MGKKDGILIIIGKIKMEVIKKKELMINYKRI
jgi:hypothetical protein